MSTTAKKGCKGKVKTGGRVKGTPNKTTSQAKAVIAEIVENNSSKAQKMLDMIVEPRDWLYAYIKLCEFVVPKMSAVSVSTDGKVSDLRSEIEEMSKQEVI